MTSSNKARAGGGERVTISFSDSIDLPHDHVHWCSKGVSLLTKWHFLQGTEIEFAFEHRGRRHCCTGIVVLCQPLRERLGYYAIVLYFVETPCTKAQKAASACRLAREITPPDYAHLVD